MDISLLASRKTATFLMLASIRFFIDVMVRWVTI